MDRYTIIYTSSTLRDMVCLERLNLLVAFRIYLSIYVSLWTHTHAFVYIYTHTHTHIYIYIYI